MYVDFVEDVAPLSMRLREEHDMKAGTYSPSLDGRAGAAVWQSRQRVPYTGIFTWIRCVEKVLNLFERVLDHL